MAFDPSFGTEGRVRVGANVVVSGITSWRITKRVAEIPYPHFESTADADSQVWTDFAKGLGDATVELEGLHNVDATDKTEAGTPGLYVGATLALDLAFDRTLFGYSNLAGFITVWDGGMNINNQPGTFKCTVRLTGTVGKAASF